MAEAKTYTYKEEAQRQRIFKKVRLKVSSEDLWTSLVGIFVAMAMPLPGIAPFGMAFLSQERKLTLKAVLIFVAISIGSAAVSGRIGALKYLCAGIIYLSTLFILEKGVRLSDVTSGIIAGVSVMVTGLGALLVEGFSVLGLILVLCEGALVVSGALMMEKSISAIKDGKIFTSYLDGDSKLSLAAVILVALLGFKEIYIGSGFSVMNFASSIMLMVVSAGCGAGFSTGAGIVLGIISGIGGDFFLAALGAFGFCGFLAGAFSKFGKGGAVAGILLANAVMAVYNNYATESILSLWEILTAAVVFFFVPTVWIEKVKKVISLGSEERDAIAKVKESIKAKLNAAAAAFESMARTMERLSDKEVKKNGADVAELFDAAADKVCKNCRKSGVCWGQYFSSTYEEMLKLLGIMREKGVAKSEDLSQVLSKRCINTAGLLEELNHQYDIYRVRQVWRSRLSESRQLVGKQLDGVSKILEGLTSEIDTDTREIAVSGFEIRSKLELNGIKPKSVNILQDKDERYKVEVVMKAAKFQGKTRRTIEKVMKSHLGFNTLMREEVPDDKKLIRLVFTEAQRYEVETEEATLAASEKSGDNFRFLNLKNGKFIIAISDGMGTGSRPAKESEAILELLDSFLEAGFDSRIAVRLINSIMIMKSEDAAFVTLDLCIIDLYTGEAQFIKTGAEPSFILSNTGRVRSVNASALPVGIIAEAEADISKTKLRDGDKIVMMTDGIETNEEGYRWVGEFVKESGQNEENRNLAEDILNRAAQKQGGTAKDDMTVLTITLKEAG